MMKKIVLLFLLALSSFSAFAQQQTITLHVPSMNCVTCPFTIKRALQNVEGVNEVDVTFETKLAVVIFDDEKTIIEALIEATTNAGYPSSVKTQG
jgi:mercuric ion binding protein